MRKIVLTIKSTQEYTVHVELWTAVFEKGSAVLIQGK